MRKIVFTSAFASFLTLLGCQAEPPDDASQKDAAAGDTRLGHDSTGEMPPTDPTTSCEFTSKRCKDGASFEYSDPCNKFLSKKRDCQYACKNGSCVSREECTPDCEDRECGPDPKCEKDCGDCSGIRWCDEEPGQCKVADSWLKLWLNGERVFANGIASATYDVSDDSAEIVIPQNYIPDAKISVNLGGVSENTSYRLSCGQTKTEVRLLLKVGRGESIPARWREEFFRNECDSEQESFDLEISKATTEHVEGSFEATYIGSGPRDGDTLRVEAEIDAELHQE